MTYVNTYKSDPIHTQIGSHLIPVYVATFSHIAILQAILATTTFDPIRIYKSLRYYKKSKNIVVKKCKKVVTRS